MVAKGVHEERFAVQLVSYKKRQTRCNGYDGIIRFRSIGTDVFVQSPQEDAVSMRMRITESGHPSRRPADEVEMNSFFSPKITGERETTVTAGRVNLLLLFTD